MQRIIVSVINDLTTDQRVDKVCNSLDEMGFDVLLVGRKLPKSLPLERKYQTHRLKLVFNTGYLFYAEYNIRLFLFLLVKKKSILLSNDLDTLLANYLVSKIQNKKLVYDSHELFTEVPELINRSRVQKVWLSIEKFIVPKLKNTYTVCQSIADYYNNKYQTDFKVVRNIPVFSNIQSNDVIKHKSQEPIPKSKVQSPKSKDHRPKTKDQKPKTIIYQGALNVGRGLELMIETMQYLENCQFIIVGDGKITDKITALVHQKKMNSNVILLGEKTPLELKKITPQADLGISIEEDLGLSYRFALPNKLFDYIHANIPVLVSDLPEMKRIVLDYNIGEVITDRNPKNLAKKIQKLLKMDKTAFKTNLEKAALELQWENEEKVLKSIFENLK